MSNKNGYIERTKAEQEAFIREQNRRYDEWFFSKEAKRQYDVLMERYAPAGFEGYADPDSPRGRRLRAKHAKEGTRREPRRGSRRIRVLSKQLTPKEKFAIFKRDNYRCRICGSSPQNSDGLVLHVDHITPRSKGGGNDPMNLWTLCADCNIGKGTDEL